MQEWVVGDGGGSGNSENYDKYALKTVEWKIPDDLLVLGLSGSYIYFRMSFCLCEASLSKRGRTDESQGIEIPTNRDEGKSYEKFGIMKITYNIFK